MVHGRGQTAGAALVTHPDVPTISFTGSTPVGKWIGKECGDRLKRCSLELGGKNPFVVFADADMAAALPTAARAAFANQGQICLCGSRLLLHESIADEFTRHLVAWANQLKAGDPADPATKFGAAPRARPTWRKSIRSSSSRELSGRVLAGGASTRAISPPAAKGLVLPTHRHRRPRSLLPR